ncbi:SRPBCC domain-containing protein [Ornithinibacillus sp. BX22]|uniref:SRPBCC domain-containing protein n=1 Tax=Ornithinibacillus hominis TaxID=2763055 RepID=A0A923RHC9_9BACI|nr:SRPBCC domain-containing protein [Ornithinibacillus hominis]MBC5636500.1 SRPBCC domain-containing protein [Ornithinibacillus hominis]
MTKVRDSVKREIIVDAPLEKVWDALTKPEHLNRWYTKEANMDFRVGGKGYMNHGWGATSEGMYTEIEAMNRFVLQSFDGNFATITELEEVENGIKVSIEYRAPFINEMDVASKENMLFGTGQFLANLKAVYESGQDNRQHFWQTWIGVTHTSMVGGGTKIVSVIEDSNAAKAGLLAGDIVNELDGEPVLGYESFERLVNNKAINQTVQLKIVRDKEEFALTCEVAAYPVAY